MSTYRFNTPGSWSSKNITNEQINHNEDKVIKMLGLFNDYTENEYGRFVNKRIDRICIARYVREDNMQALRNIGYKKIISVCGVKGTVGVLCGVLLNKLND